MSYFDRHRSGSRDRRGELGQADHESKVPGRSPVTAKLPASAHAIARAIAGELRGEPPVAQVQAKGGLDGPDVHAAAAHGLTGTAATLPFLEQIQRAFGHHDVSGVRAHVGGPAAEASAAMNARAYASGDAVAFASAPDLHLAAHEAAHVVQQRGGVRLSGGVGRAGDEYEQHADAVADAVVRGESAEALLDRYAHRGAAGGPAVQRDGEHDAPRSRPRAPAAERGAGAHVEAGSSLTLHEWKVIEDRPLGPYVLMSAAVSGTIEWEIGEAHHAGEHGGAAHHAGEHGAESAEEEDTGPTVQVGPTGQLGETNPEGHAESGHVGIAAQVRGRISTGIRGMRPTWNIGGALTNRGGRFGLGVSGGTLHFADGWIEVPLPSARIDLFRLRAGHEPEFCVATITVPVPAALHFTIPVGGRQVGVTPNLEVEFEFKPNVPAIMEWWASQAGSTAAAEGGGALATEAAEGGAELGTEAATLAEGAGELTAEELASAGVTAVGLADAIAVGSGLLAGALTVVAAIDTLRQADDIERYGELATRGLYHYCLSYTGTFLAGRHLSGSDGAAGHQAATTDLQRIAQQHHTTVDRVRAVARELGARRIYDAAFRGAMPGYRDRAAHQAASLLRDAPGYLIEGQLMRARWGTQWFASHGGSQGL